MTIIIIDYGIGNLASVHRSLQVCGVNAVVSDNPDDLKTATGIILPGVGAFIDGITQLRTKGWVQSLQEEVISNKIPLLGICLGMQLLAESSTEGKGETEGLGFIKGRVVRFEPTSLNEKIPQVGWNEVTQKTPHKLFGSIPNHKDFYFVHSYHFIASDQAEVLGTTPYCGEFSSVLAKDNIFGAQFHPEKSQAAGLQFLKNFAALC